MPRKKLSARKKLRVGLLLSSLQLPDWTSKLLQSLQKYPTVEIVWLSVSEDRSKERAARVRANSAGVSVLYRCYSHFDRKRGTFSVASPAMEKAPSRFVTLSNGAEGQAECRALDLNIILAFGEQQCPPEVFGAAPYGVWEYHYGSLDREPGAAGGFWEVFEARPVSEVSLLARLDYDGPSYILSKTAVRTHPTSPAINRRRIQLAGVSLLHYALRSLLQRECAPDQFVTEHAILGREGEALPAYPTNLQMLYFLTMNFFKVITGRALARRAVVQWSIGVTHEKPLGLSTTKVEDIRWFLPDRTRFLADPFFVEQDGKTWIFVEEFSYETKRGHIAVTEFTESGTFTGLVPVLVRDFHLSFPFVLCHGETLFLLPEQSSTGQVVLYQCQAFPDRWEERSVLLRDFPGVDNILFFRDGYWWLFTSYGDYGNHDNNLHLFYAEDLFGEFVPHPNNPVKLNLRGSRMAGNVFEQDGKLVRPGQNCSLRYGGSVVLFEITTLSTTEFEEREIKEIKPSPDSPFSEGFHTINSLHDLTAVAGFRYITRSSGGRGILRRARHEIVTQSV